MIARGIDHDECSFCFKKINDVFIQKKLDEKNKGASDYDNKFSSSDTGKYETTPWQWLQFTSDTVTAKISLRFACWILCPVILCRSFFLENFNGILNVPLSYRKS